MSTIEDVLKEISKVCEENTEEKYKKYIIGNLYDLIEEKKELFGITENNAIYLFDTTPKMIEIPETDVFKAIKDYRKNGYLSEEKVNTILDYSVYKAREYVSSFGINIRENVLNGYCGLMQYLILYPLEKLGFKVTKNNTINSFDSTDNHKFGTVTFKVKENNEIKNKIYLIDGTYRQFFTSEKCNKGMYYIGKTPDAGYFVKNKALAKKLTKDGYIILNEYTAKEYGEPFYKSSLELNENPNKNIDYYNNIITSKENYEYIDDDESYEWPVFGCIKK